MEEWAQTFTSLVDSGETYVFLLPIYTVLLLGERVAHRLTRKTPWDDLDSAANIAITVATLGLNVILGHLFPVAVMVWTFSHLSLWNLAEIPGGALIAFLLYDLAWYTDHRIAHRTGLFWSMHHVHHSSESYNMTVASRGFILDNSLLTRPTFYLLPILGVTPTMFVVIVILTSIWGIAQHTRLVGRLGWLDFWLATPSNHRVHHGSDDKYLDRNYGEVLMVWDHLFGTYQAEEEEPSYGVTESIGTRNPLRIEVAGLRWLYRKLRASPGWLQRIQCLYRPPGWQPPKRGN